MGLGFDKLFQRMNDVLDIHIFKGQNHYEEKDIRAASIVTFNCIYLPSNCIVITFLSVATTSYTCRHFLGDHETGITVTRALKQGRC